MTQSTFIWFLWLLSAGLLAVMVWISALHLQPGGTMVLDAWIFPYSAADVDAYLRALGPQGVNKYLQILQLIDTIFPALLALAIVLTFLRMVRRATSLQKGLFLSLPLAYLAFDYGENAMIADMLRNWPEAADAGIAKLASRLTTAKFAALALAAVVMFLIVVVRDARNAK